MPRYAPTEKELAIALEKAGAHIKAWGGPPDMLAAYITAFIAGIEYVKQQPSPSPVEGQTADLIAKLQENIRTHLNPYNLGDMGETTKQINELIKIVQTPSQSVKGMRWICAANQLPETNKPESLKGKVKRSIASKCVYSDSCVIGYDDKTMYCEGRNDDIYIAFTDLEWLCEDESPSDTLKVDAMEFAEWMRKQNVQVCNDGRWLIINTPYTTAKLYDLYTQSLKP